MKTIFTLFTFLLTLSAQSQYYYQYFDGADTSAWNSVFVDIDTTNPTNIWQIGPPQKPIFNAASTVPNVIVTDTVNHYPDNNTSSFSFWLDPSVFAWNIIAIQWYQKLDMDDSLDYGNVEFSIDNGVTWQSAWNNPYVYNYYGFLPSNVYQNGSGEDVFSGTDTMWRDIWLCFDGSFLSWTDTLRCRFTFVSDSITGQNEGWMIDNFMVHPTFIHTVEEIEQTEYIAVSPNPSTGIVNIQAKKLKEFHVIQGIRVVNLKGETVKEYGLLPTKTWIDLKDLPEGEYFLHITTNLRTDTKKIILKRD